MATPSYTQSLDTMVTTAIDTFSRDPINALTDSGEKFLKAAATNGRVFVVNDAEGIRHPILYGHGENSSLYTPDELTGTPDGVNNLSTSAKEILTMAVFHLHAGTRNINFPQSQPAGNLIDYVSNVIKANMMKIFNEEEILFTQGRTNGTTGVVATNAPSTTDADYSAALPMSLSSIYHSSSIPSSEDIGGDTTSESFANVKTDDVAKWQPSHINATSTDHSTLITDLQTAILEASYSAIERPTHVYMALGSFEKMLALLRASAALPDPVNANLGKEGTISFGGISLDWSRYLAADVVWDTVDPEDTTATYPILGVNWNSLRLNTVRAGSPGSNDIGFIRQLGEMQPHPTLTNLFKRIEWKRQWSVDNGRRSFFTIGGTSGYTSIA